MKFAVFLYLLLALPVLAAPLPAGARAALDRVAGTLKAAVRGLTVEQVHAVMTRQYRTLRLLDERGQWTVPALASRGRELLPAHADGAELARFVDRMADAAAGNPYLLAFLDQASRERFPQLERKLEVEGARVLPDATVHALVLEQLTAAMASDYRVNEACLAHWRRVADARREFWSSQSFFARIKTRSVNLGVDLLNRWHRELEVNPRGLALTLPLNILEAVGAEVLLALRDGPDARAGHLANARAGLTLATHGPAQAGPTSFSEDGALIAIRPRSVKEWDDLYATWNMAFCVTIGNWPYWFAKLVIPSVNDYADDPATYINRRALALEVQMYVNGLELMDGTQQPLDWRDPAMARVWGAANRESARDYRARARLAP